MSYIYIASPFTHDDPAVRQARHDQVLKYTHHLIETGYIPFSPIVHCKPIADTFELPHSFDFWEVYDFTMIQPAKELHVLTIDGWINSKGVAAEIKLARMMQKPIFFVRYDTGLEMYMKSP